MTVEDSPPTPDATGHASPAPSRGQLHLVLAGAPLDNDNRGVEALGRSVVEHLMRSGALHRLSVLDGGWGVRDRDGYEAIGVRNSRRWHRRESWTRIRFDLSLGGLGNPAARRFAEADAVLDISGGDSFTDLYGAPRLATVSLPKEVALQAGRPLVLLPQTYGPFHTQAGRIRAERIVRSAALAYSRDDWSHDQLLDLAGTTSSSSHLRKGVDVAFALEAKEPPSAVANKMHELRGEVVAGVNLSGLLRTPADHAKFGLAGDYLSTMTTVVRSLVAAGAVVLLVPHVHGEQDGENDATAIHSVQAALSPAERSRTWMLPPQLRAAELKWCIARTSWFTGARMHANIAALSSQVPAFGYAYSDKTRGVFGTCGVAEHTTDARQVAGQEAVARALASFESRDMTRHMLARRIPGVVARAREQLDEVLLAAQSLRETPGG